VSDEIYEACTTARTRRPAPTTAAWSPSPPTPARSRRVLRADAATPSALETGAPDVFVLDGFSKRYAMTGFRLGYVIAPPAAARALQVMQQNLFISASEFVQRAGIAALEQGGPTLAAMRERYARQRRLLLDGLARIGLRVHAPPEGAFYVLADARHVDPDSRRLAFRLLEQAHVAVTPGVDFGPYAEGFLRFSYAVSEATLTEALARLGTRW
jgi:aspartate/methionine/tyrosine aminotransferase